MLMPTKLAPLPASSSPGVSSLAELHLGHVPQNHPRHKFITPLEHLQRHLSLDSWIQPSMTTATLQPSGKKYNWVLPSSLGTINREWLIFCYKALATWVVICPSVLYVPDSPLLPSCCIIPALCSCTRCKVGDIREPGRRPSEPLT